MAPLPASSLLPTIWCFVAIETALLSKPSWWCRGRGLWRAGVVVAVNDTAPPDDSGPLHQPRGIQLCHSPLGLPFSWYVREESVGCRCSQQSRAPSTLGHRQQGASMIAVSFKCRCQILRRLTKGTVILFLFTHRVCCGGLQTQFNGFYFQIWPSFQFTVRPQRTPWNMYRCICAGDSAWLSPHSLVVFMLKSWTSLHVFFSP